MEKEYEQPLFYQEKGSDKVEMTVITSTGDLTEIQEKVGEALKGKSIQMAFIVPCDWMIKPE